MVRITKEIVNDLIMIVFEFYRLLFDSKVGGMGVTCKIVFKGALKVDTIGSSAFIFFTQKITKIK